MTKIINAWNYKERTFLQACFPDSDGKLCTDEVLDALEGHHKLDDPDFQYLKGLMEFLEENGTHDFTVPYFSEDSVDRTKYAHPHRITLHIEGLYGWGKGYLSHDFHTGFNDVVEVFAQPLGYTLSRSSHSSGPQISSAEFYGYFMGMECVFYGVDLKKLEGLVEDFSELLKERFPHVVCTTRYDAQERPAYHTL
jgi:hypothetical protein